jgi:hypothetical protein
MAKYTGLRKTDGGEIPEGEPYFILRARDILVIPAIETYRSLAVTAQRPPSFIGEIDAHIERIRQWQAQHGTKLPD